MKMNYFFYVLFTIVLVGCTPTFHSVQVPRPNTTYPYAQVEPSIAIHPHDTQLMIAGTVLDDYYYSTDGGKSWISSTLKSEFGVGGDPVVHIDNKGRYYYFHLSNPANGRRLDRIVCSYTDTISGAWQSSATEVIGKKAQDKEWVAECPLTGNLYLTWTQFDEYNSKSPKDSSHIMFAVSTNQGESWSPQKRINKFGGDCLDGSNTVEGAVPAVGPDGTIYVAWSGPKGLRMNKSMDQGETWLAEELFVNEQPGGWKFDVPEMSRANGLPITKCDVSGGAYNGRVYVNWADQRNGANDTDVWLAYSDDKGETWTDAIRVNQDNTTTHQYFTWMDIDQTTGYLYFIYYDRRAYDDHRTDVYVSVSKDGGATFKEYKITDKPFAPSKAIFFGDYLNIAAHKGVVRPIWPRMDNGEISLWVTLF